MRADAYLLPPDEGLKYIGWTVQGTHGGVPHSTAYAVCVETEHAEAWRAHLDRTNEKQVATCPPGALWPTLRKAYAVHDRWPNNGTVMATYRGAPPECST